MPPVAICYTGQVICGDLFLCRPGEVRQNTQKCPFDGHYTTETSTIAFNSEKYELISYDNIYLSNVLSMSWLNEASPAIWKRFLSENTATICLVKHKKLESTYLVVLNVACTRDSDPVTTIQVLYSEYYFYRFIQKQVADGRVNLARDSVLYVMAGQICGGVEEPSYRMLTGGTDGHQPVMNWCHWKLHITWSGRL